MTLDNKRFEKNINNVFKEEIDQYIQDTPMFSREIIYTPYFYLQKRNHVGYINEMFIKDLIDRMTKHKN
jgi:hypothetical protein